MYQKLIIPLMLLIYPLKVYSQEYKYIPFPDSNAIWSEIYYPPIFSGEDPQLERFALPGEDTVINEITYKKLYIFYDTVFNKNNATFIGGIREDSSKRIYFAGDTILHDFKPMLLFQDSEELLLYDFSLNVGDTLWEGNFMVGPEWLVVQKIDSILIGNIKRKQFCFEPSGRVNWIEGIGNVLGLLFTSGTIPTNGLDNDLICFKQNDTILYFNNNYNACIPVITSIEEKRSENSNIQMYPNPGNSGYLIFRFNYMEFDFVDIINSKGICVFKSSIKNKDGFILNTSNYLPGIYFYKITSNKDINYTGQFIVL